MTAAQTTPAPKTIPAKNLVPGDRVLLGTDTAEVEWVSMPNSYGTVDLTFRVASHGRPERRSVNLFRRFTVAP